MKRCTKCDVEKPLDAYYVNNGKPIARCKTCHAEGSRRYYEKKSEAIAAQRKARRRRDKDQISAQRSADRKANPEKYRKWAADRWERDGHKGREYSRQWHRNNPEKAKAGRQQYYRNNPEVFDRLRSKRIALLKEVPHESWTRHQIFHRDGGICQHCAVVLNPSTQRSWEIDHIVALEHKGWDIPANLQLLCVSCNRRKRDRLIFTNLANG